jgi:hypothetical protein
MMQPNLTSHILILPDKHIVTILFCVVWYYGIVGKLDKGAVTKAICSGFKETTDPPVCLSECNSNFPLRSYLPCKALIYTNLMMSSAQLLLDLHCYV